MAHPGVPQDCTENHCSGLLSPGLLVCFLSLQKLLDRFDYDDEPDGAEDTKKEEPTAATTAVTAMTTTAPAMPPLWVS